MCKPLAGIFGGSFNPVHIGHMRLVIEVLETLSPARLDILPSAHPPHKGGRHILPFELRVALLRAATEGLSKVRVNTLENDREGPSYTVDTLRLFAEREPRFRHFFIIGAEDFAVINTWHQWERIPTHADILVVPRAGAGVDVFTRTVQTHWPLAQRITPPFTASDAAFALPDTPDAGRFIHLPLPRIDIRAELVRQRLLAGRSVRYLLPEAVRDILHNHPEVSRVWDEELGEGTTRA